MGKKKVLQDVKGIEWKGYILTIEIVELVLQSWKGNCPLNIQGQASQTRRVVFVGGIGEQH